MGVPYTRGIRKFADFFHQHLAVFWKW